MVKMSCPSKDADSFRLSGYKLSKRNQHSHRWRITSTYSDVDCGDTIPDTGLNSDNEDNDFYLISLIQTHGQTSCMTSVRGVF